MCLLPDASTRSRRRRKCSKIDSLTRLNFLIERLKFPLKFVETGKAYWIGYLNLMYSIAYHKEEAIRPLIDFIRRVNSIEAKENAIYTLHLIGIESMISGRYTEEFKNAKARIALLEFLNDNDLHQTVVSLLMRDPWRMDIAYYMDYLGAPHNDYSKVLHALNRFYLLKDGPICQQIPAYFRKITIKVKEPKSGAFPHLPEFIALKKALGKNVGIDSDLIRSRVWLDCVEKINQGEVSDYTIIVSAVLFHLVGSYERFDSRYFYSIDKKGKISIYGPLGARRACLNWWKLNRYKLLKWEPTPGFHKYG